MTIWKCRNSERKGNLGDGKFSGIPKMEMAQNSERKGNLGDGNIWKCRNSERKGKLHYVILKLSEF